MSISKSYCFDSCKVLIFDLDGLIIDSEPHYMFAWEQACLSMGFQTDAFDFTRLSGGSSDEVKTQLLSHFGSEFPLQQFFEISTDFWLNKVMSEGITIKEGVDVLLTKIRQKGWHYCIATNSERHWANFSLKYAGLMDLFPLVFTREDVLNAKPSPDIYLHCLKSLSITSDQALILEDSKIGIMAAHAAGIPCCYIPSIDPLDNEATNLATLTLKNLTQLAEII